MAKNLKLSAAVQQRTRLRTCRNSLLLTNLPRFSSTLGAILSALPLTLRGNARSVPCRKRGHQIGQAAILQSQRFPLHLCDGGAAKKIEQDLHALSGGHEANDDAMGAQKGAFGDHDLRAWV